MAVTATGLLDVAIGATLVEAATTVVPVAWVTVAGLKPLPKKPPWW
jgi:energy-converting hydrogenase Eha subunit C